MKWSNYNNYVQLEDAYIIYNALSKEIIKLNKKFIDINNLPKKLLNTLQKLGFLVDEKNNEKELAKIRFNDYIYNNELILVLFPNEDCNFRCSFCYEDFNGKYMSKRLLNAILLFLRKNITKYSKLNIDWFGGEPLLSKNAIICLSKEMIKICQEAKIPYYAGITTNGYFLDTETFQALMACKVVSYHITLCGNEKEHDAVRCLKNGQGTFEKIMNNLIEIQKIKSRLFRIYIRINVTQSMLGTLSDFLDYLSEKFGNDERFSFYFRPVGDWGGKQVENMSKELDVNHIDLFNQVFCSKCNLNYDIYYVLLNNIICATAKRNHYVIRANGDINKCSEALYKDYNKIGILDMSGNMILDENKLAKWLLTFEKNDICRRCVDWELCNNKRCPNNNFDNMSQPYCGYEKIALDEILKLLNLSGSKYIHQFLKED